MTSTLWMLKTINSIVYAKYSFIIPFSVIFFACLTKNELWIDTYIYSEKQQYLIPFLLYWNYYKHEYNYLPREFFDVSVRISVVVFVYDKYAVFLLLLDQNRNIIIVTRRHCGRRQQTNRHFKFNCISQIVNSVFEIFPGKNSSRDFCNQFLQMVAN